jgi:hypothetical protein
LALVTLCYPYIKVNAMKIPPVLPPARNDDPLSALQKRFPQLAQAQIATPQQQVHEQLYGPKRRAEQQAGKAFSTELIMGLQHLMRAYTYRKVLPPEVQAVMRGDTVVLQNYSFPGVPLGSKASPTQPMPNTGVCHELAAFVGQLLVNHGPDDLQYQVFTGRDTQYFSQDGASHTMILAYPTQDAKAIQRALKSSEQQASGKFPDGCLIIDPSNQKVGVTAGTPNTPPSQTLAGYTYLGPDYSFKKGQPLPLNFRDRDVVFRLRPSAADPGFNRSSSMPLGLVRDVLPETELPATELVNVTFCQNQQTGQTNPLLSFFSAEGHIIETFDPKLTDTVICGLKETNPLKRFFNKLTQDLSQG